METVDLILDTHIKRCGNGSFFLIAVIRADFAVVSVVCQFVDQCRIAVECEDNRLILCKESHHSPYQTKSVRMLVYWTPA